MKILQTDITPGNNSCIAVVERDLPVLKVPFHCHPELELVYIKEGQGKRIIGDHIAPFEAGDMVFMGSNLPHKWMGDGGKAIVLYFNKDLLGSAFYDLPEAGKIKALFHKAVRGIGITGDTCQVIACQLEQLLQQNGFEKVLGLLAILHQLSCSQDIRLLASENYHIPPSDAGTDRLADVRKYVQEHYSSDISLHTVAGIANLTRPSFCRLFRQRVNKPFVEYLNEVRIANACKYLLDTDLGIAEIAHHCGYKTVSNFNKQFKKITGASPKAYRSNSGV